MSISGKTVFYSVGNFAAASAVYWYLITGGWLTNHYHLDDPNIVNLGLAIFEPIAVLGVIAYWIWRTRFLYLFLFILFLVQLVIGAGFVAFIGLFFFTWKPKMM